MQESKIHKIKAFLMECSEDAAAAGVRLDWWTGIRLVNPAGSGSCGIETELSANAVLHEMLPTQVETAVAVVEDRFAFLGDELFHSRTGVRYRVAGASTARIVNPDPSQSMMVGLHMLTWIDKSEANDSGFQEDAVQEKVSTQRVFRVKHRTADEHPILIGGGFNLFVAEPREKAEEFAEHLNAMLSRRT